MSSIFARLQEFFSVAANIPRDQASEEPLRQLYTDLQSSIGDVEGDHTLVEGDYTVLVDYMPGEYHGEADVICLRLGKKAQPDEPDNITATGYIYHDQNSQTFKVSRGPSSSNAFKEELGLNFDEALEHLNSKMADHYQLAKNGLNSVRPTEHSPTKLSF